MHAPAPTHSKKAQLRSATQQGLTLVVVLIILAVVSILGAGGAQIALMSERGARNDRDQLLAFQSAEAALVDAELDIDPAVNSANVRKLVFDGKPNVIFPSAGCGTSGSLQGLCAAPPEVGKPVWLTIDFTDSSNSAPSTAFGTFSLRTFAAGGVGAQPAKPPRYIIEPITVQSGDPSNPDILYRVTAIGFGPRADIQSVIQMLYRI
jgi:type IV pilus assembly protein PilX